jgi:hypothetical protein
MKTKTKRPQNAQRGKPWKVTVDPTLTDRYPDDLFAEKAARARAFLEAHPLPEGFTLDPTMNPHQEGPGLAEKLAQAASIEKYGLPEKTGGKPEN